jgi:hypothetical protein
MIINNDGVMEYWINGILSKKQKNKLAEFHQIHHSITYAFPYFPSMTFWVKQHIRITQDVLIKFLLYQANSVPYK